MTRELSTWNNLVFVKGVFLGSKQYYQPLNPN